MPEVQNIEPGPDTFRILLTTDNHVGYMENDQIRGDDSWKTFSEILDIGRDNDVDMILQGGDLFHINVPTKKSYYHVMRSLREHCWCNKPIEYKLVSDPSDAMATKHFMYPAEYDCNINVGMPIYAISGNHDDATGEELLSPLDILSVSGLLNHFGRIIDNEQITICPLLFNKGKTNLALYGLHSIREERLMKTMASGNLEFLEPDTTDDPNIKWFNLMCIHQNHVHRPGVKVVEETCLPSFLDFILWGHEHDCKPSAMRNDITGSYVLQAGSSIATSLSEGETLDKHVFILSVNGKDFSLKPIRLKSVRPFVMKDVILSKTGLSATSSNKKQVLNFLISEVELMIGKANFLWKQNNKELFESGVYVDSDIPLPLIRLRVEYSGGYEVENPRFFSNRFVGKVANINDVVLYYKRRKYDNDRKDKLLVSKDEMENLTDDDLNYEDNLNEEHGENNIMEMINEKLNDKDLIMLTKKKVSDTLESLLEHDEDKNILNKFVQNEEEDHINLLQKLTLEGDLNNIDESEDNNNLVITSDVKDVKKSFRELAKRIKAETQYSTVPEINTDSIININENSKNNKKVNTGPIFFNSNTASTQTQKDGMGGTNIMANKTENNSGRRKKVKSDEFVVNSSSEEEEEENGNKEGHGDKKDAEDSSAIESRLIDIPAPSMSARGRGALNRRGRGGHGGGKISTNTSTLDMLLGRKR